MGSTDMVTSAENFDNIGSSDTERRKLMTKGAYAGKRTYKILDTPTVRPINTCRRIQVGQTETTIIQTSRKIMYHSV
jgi:hypothetical protein